MPTLTGRHVALVPLTLEHADPLFEISEPDLFTWFPQPPVGRDGMQGFVREALQARDAGTAEPFAITLRATGEIVGSTRFANIAREHRRLEIGWTWLAKPWQRTVVNTEAKLLLLTEAFDQQRMLRVELKCDALNAPSRTAILRLGAKEEGTLRQHITMASGRQRDTVYYSILASQWPDVQLSLVTRSNSSQKALFP